MRPTFMGFETATRGLMTNQKSLDVVGHNLTNIGVTGYTRQRADLVSLSVNGRYARYQNNRTQMAGQGSTVYGVNQLRDKFLDKRFREEYADVGYYNVTSSVLEDLSNAIDEVSPATMTSAMNKFQDAWNELLGKTMNEETGAANLLAAATQIVQVFRQISSKIDNVWEQQQYGLSLDLETVNSTLQRIAQLNEEIVRQQHNALEQDNTLYQPLELLDQRNVLLDQLSGFADIQYEAQEDGSVTVWMGAKSDDNPPVVKGDKFEKLAMSVNDDDPQYKTVSVFWNNTGKEVSFLTGSLRGALDMLNGRGLAMNGQRGETYTEGILYYKDKVDAMAKVFVEAFNNVVEIDDGSSISPRYKALFAFENDSYENAAGIRINPEWESDSAYLIKNVKYKIEEGESDNSYAAKGYAKFAEALDFGEFNGTFTDYISFYSVTKLSNNKAFSDTRGEAVTSISETLLDQIQQISGVSMDEEGVDMMQYKKAYDAVSRVFTTLDEMLDKLINGTGVVGR